MSVKIILAICISSQCLFSREFTATPSFSYFLGRTDLRRNLSRVKYEAEADVEVQFVCRSSFKTPLD